jgi:hypothetical protein
MEGLGDFDEVHGIGRFEEVIVAAELAGFFDVFVTRGGGEHDDRQRFEMGPAANPLKDLKAGLHGHIYIQHDEAGKGMEFAAGEVTCAGKVVNRALAMGHGLKRISDASAFEGPFEEEDVVRFVFRIKHRGE